MKTAYQVALEYQETMRKYGQAIKNGQATSLQQIEQLMAEKTTEIPDTILIDQLRANQADLVMLAKQVQSIEDAGGIEGILQDDAQMKKLAVGVYLENTEELDSLKGNKEALMRSVAKLYKEFTELKIQITRHNAAVKVLENEIDAIKQYLPHLASKVKYRHQEASFPRNYHYATNVAVQTLQDLSLGSHVKG